MRTLARRRAWRTAVRSPLGRCDLRQPAIQRGGLDRGTPLKLQATGNDNGNDHTALEWCVHVAEFLLPVLVSGGVLCHFLCGAHVARGAGGSGWGSRLWPIPMFRIQASGMHMDSQGTNVNKDGEHENWNWPRHTTE